VKVSCGYQHALLLTDKGYIYTLGQGLNGQLALGFDVDFTEIPKPVEIVNSEHDKILLISCGASFSIAYSELGILYCWGMMVPDDYDSI